jgi:hypothetical protein
MGEDQAGAVEEHVYGQLLQLRSRAGNPSLRRLADLVAEKTGLMVSHVTLGNMLRPDPATRTWPNWNIFRAVVVTLGGDWEQLLEPWRVLWQAQRARRLRAAAYAADPGALTASERSADALERIAAVLERFAVALEVDDRVAADG